LHSIKEYGARDPGRRIGVTKSFHNIPFWALCVSQLIKPGGGGGGWNGLIKKKIKKKKKINWAFKKNIGKEKEIYKKK
jgi:hypothetical protein